MESIGCPEPEVEEFRDVPSKGKYGEDGETNVPKDEETTEGGWRPVLHPEPSSENKGHVEDDEGDAEGPVGAHEVSPFIKVKLFLKLKEADVAGVEEGKGLAQISVNLHHLSQVKSRK